MACRPCGHSRPTPIAALRNDALRRKALPRLLPLRSTLRPGRISVLAYPPITQFSRRDKMARVLIPRSSSPCCCCHLLFPFCNDRQAPTIKLVNLLKHSVYFSLVDQPTFIGSTDHSLLVPPFGAPGPEPNKARDRAQGSDLQKQCPCQQHPLHFSSPS
jgi:hypothetical protein